MTALRRTLTLLVAATLFPAAGFHALTGIGAPIGASTTVGFQPEVPAGYAFAIWGPIFALISIYAVRQALPGQRSNELYGAIGWTTVVSTLLLSVWMVLAQTLGNGWWLVVIFFAALASALTAFFRVLDRLPRLDRFDRWIVLPMTALLAAWSSAAVWLNVSGVVRLWAPDRFGLSNAAFALAVLAVITVFTWSVLRRARGNAWYAGTLIWALVGIVEANGRNPNGEQPVALAAAGVALLTLALALLLPVRTAQRSAST